MLIVTGLLCVVMGGLVSGSGAWPMKLMRHYRFEHWWFVSMLTGLLVVPWSVAWLFCPDFARVLGEIPVRALVVSNLWAAGWGVANILCGLCYVRIGVGLTTAVLTGLGVCMGVVLPMVIKGSGAFEQSPDMVSMAGLTVLGGAVVALLAVVVAARAGMQRECEGGEVGRRRGSIFRALLAAITAGVLSAGMNLAFVYGQGPVIALTKAHGAGEISSIFAFWAVGLFSGAWLSVGYAAFLMTRQRSWAVLLKHPNEFLLALIIGLNMALSIVLLGRGMLWLGALGASVGSGMSLIAWMLGGQLLGFLSGEWHGVNGRPKKQIVIAIGLLIFAALIMAYGNFHAGTTAGKNR